MIRLVIIFAIVDFPEPDSPTNPKDSPSKILKETLSRAFSAVISFFDLIIESESNILVKFFISNNLSFVIDLFPQF